MQLGAVQDLLRERTGLVFHPPRVAQLRSALAWTMEHAQIHNPHDLVARLSRDQALLDHLVANLAVGETYFFREPEHFGFIHHHIIPEHRARPTEPKPFQAWSAGCSTGEEAYSLAMVLKDSGFDASSARVMATDLSTHALACGRLARYRPWSVRGESGALAKRHLEWDGSLFRVPQAIRDMVCFHPLNLVTEELDQPGADPTDQDLILCRNVLIYFDARTVHPVARRLWKALVPGGWLITSSADPPLQDLGLFHATTTSAGVLYRKPQDTNLPTGSRAQPDPSCLHHALDRVAAALSVTPGTAPPEVVDTPEPNSPNHDDAALDAGMEGVRALAATGNLDGAITRCDWLVRQHPLSAPLHFLHATLLTAAGQRELALQSTRRVLYLDRSLAAAHFLHAQLLEQQEDLPGALRAYQTTRALCLAMPPQEVVRLGDGVNAERLAALADRQVRVLQGR